MKRFRSTLLALLALGLGPAGAWAGPGDGIAGTAHDFSGKSASGGSTTGLCTFCHTPHKALQTQLLWNHTLSTNTFSWDAAATTAGTSFPSFRGDTYKGPTAKCLSCHDGSVAIGDIAWFSGARPGVVDSERHGSGNRVNVGFGGNLAGNHPVAMPYPYLNARNTYNNTTTGVGDTLSDWRATPLAPVRVFNDDGAGNISAGPVATKTGIECSSCHDPHNKAAVEKFFLRGSLSGSDTNYLCLKCHVK